MELKEYQKSALLTLSKYFEALAEARAKELRLRAVDAEYTLDAPRRAWELLKGSDYLPAKNGLGEDIPNFYLKVPTAGGKTLLACHAVDIIQRRMLLRQTGIVLWIVPSNQIYRQTLSALRDRSHPYRNALDIASSGRTIIIEKTDRFRKSDVEFNLIVMLLMLPSANRLNKETLRLFMDSAAFEDFFPGEDDRSGHRQFLERFPNLDAFEDPTGHHGRQVKTSLGNLLRVLKPVIILDEGHKAYSETARNTIRGFNPSVVLELSATPPANSNKLVNISGQELNREGMIKLDLHIINKSTLQWKSALRAAVLKRQVLERKAQKLHATTSQYIRPICLIQVERTGREQRGKGYIHAEDAKTFLTSECAIDPSEIAVKSSERDDIEGIDLLSKDCAIRYIITKQALQEGWDCPFAYVLAILTNTHSLLSITQLVGRILRQPNARKTGVRDLDESYVVCYRPKTAEVLAAITQAFEEEGLGDLSGRVAVDRASTAGTDETPFKSVGYRKKFKPFEGRIYLPKFVIQDPKGYRDVSYDMDILSRVDWSRLDFTPFETLTLPTAPSQDQELVLGLGNDPKELLHKRRTRASPANADINHVVITRQLIDLVPNPWIALTVAQKALAALSPRYSPQAIADHLQFVLDELAKHLEKERDRLAERVFRNLIRNGALQFFLLTGKGAYQLPSKLRLPRTTRQLVRDDHSPLQRSLFTQIPEEGLNPLEQQVALYLDKQGKLLWWYRNLAREDYYLQGWKKGRIYPDFVAASSSSSKPNKYSMVFVLETKGIHLKNEDTAYKTSVFDLCNHLGKKISLRSLQLHYQVVFEDEWGRVINQLLQ